MAPKMLEADGVGARDAGDDDRELVVGRDEDRAAPDRRDESEDSDPRHALDAVEHVDAPLGDGSLGLLCLQNVHAYTPVLVWRAGRAARFARWCDRRCGRIRGGAAPPRYSTVQAAVKRPSSRRPRHSVPRGPVRWMSGVSVGRSVSPFQRQCGPAGLRGQMGHEARHPAAPAGRQQRVEDAPAPEPDRPPEGAGAMVLGGALEGCAPAHAHRQDPEAAGPRVAPASPADAQARAHAPRPRADATVEPTETAVSWPWMRISRGRTRRRACGATGAARPRAERRTPRPRSDGESPRTTGRATRRTPRPTRRGRSSAEGAARGLSGARR